MPKPLKRQTRNIVSQLTGSPLMLLESHLDQIRSALIARHAGEVESRDEFLNLLRMDLPERERVQSRTQSLNFDPQDDDDFLGPVVIEGGICILQLTGVLAPQVPWWSWWDATSTEEFAQWWQQAQSDSRVTTIVTKVDTPGGSASGNEELSKLIYMSRGAKPAIAVAQGMVASAGYYNARAFETLYASPSTEVGSVGCYMIHGESSKADEMYGYTYTVIKAGENKAAGNSVEPLNAKSKAVLQGRIDAFYTQFVDAVALYSGKTSAQVESAFGQGKVMLAEQALSAGMIDGIKTFDEVLMSLKEKTPTGKPVRGTSGGSSTLRTEAKEGQSMWKDVKAALIEQGIIAADAGDDLAKVALAAFAKAHEKEVPKTEAEALALLKVKPVESKEQPAAGQPGTQQQQPAQPAAQPAAGAATAPDPKAAAAAERARILNIQAAGELLGLDEKTISAAVDSGQTVDAVMNEWRSTKSEGEKPVGKIVPGAQQRDNLAEGALQSLSLRAGVMQAKDVAATSRDLLNLRMVDIGKALLGENGRLPVGMDEESLAKAMLGNTQFGEMQVFRMSDAGYQRPGDFPGILSALMGKMLDNAQELTETTFREWTGQLPSVPDFKPKTIHAVGEFGELPEHEDTKPFVESATSEEAAWIQVDEYGDNWSLTPRMILDDDLGALMDVAEGKQTAHDMTLERLCVNLLVGNAPAQDNIAMFDSSGLRNVTVNGASVNQTNEVATGSGAAPSTAQLNLMRKLARKIYGISGKVKLNQTIKTLLIPEDLETAADQLLGLNVTQVPVTETTTNVFRGKVNYLVVPMLSESSTVQYYGITSARRRAIVRCFQRGFENMRTVSYYDPRTNCRVWQFSGRFAAAVRTWRTIIRNQGQ